MSISQESSVKLEELRNLLDTTSQRENTTEVVSLVAYLIGVRKQVFDNPHEPPQPEVYDRLQADKRARIVRNLCVIRNAIEHYFKKINDELKNYRGIYSLTEYIPQESIDQLAADGVNVFKKNAHYLGEHVVEINRLIRDRINNCKPLFPTWLNWEYIKDIFIMPDGLTVEGTKAAAEEFYERMSFYPYGVYLNWPAYECGNILYNDKKFVLALYEWNHDQFTQLNRVEDAGDYVTGNIYDFIEQGDKIVFFVDCENSDPYNFCAAIEALEEQYTGKIEKIILFDDVHTSSGWSILSDHVPIPVEYVAIERILEHKSLLDMKLAMRVSQEYYQNHVDAFVIVSSDSDYWAVITELPTARFLVMIEHGKSSPDMRDALDERGIFYCYIDEFNSARSEGLRLDAMFREMNGYIQEHLDFNFRDMMDAALTATRMNMDEAEKRQFYDKYIKTFQADIGPQGELEIRLKRV